MGNGDGVLERLYPKTGSIGVHEQKVHLERDTQSSKLQSPTPQNVPQNFLTGITSRRLQTLACEQRTSSTFANVYTPAANWSSSSYFPSHSTLELTLSSSKNPFDTSPSGQYEFMSSENSYSQTEIKMESSEDSSCYNEKADYDPETVDKYGDFHTALLTSLSNSKSRECRAVNFNLTNHYITDEGSFVSFDGSKLSYPSSKQQLQSTSSYPSLVLVKGTTEGKCEHQSGFSSSNTSLSQHWQTEPHHHYKIKYQDKRSTLPHLTLGKLKLQSASEAWQHPDLIERHGVKLAPKSIPEVGSGAVLIHAPPSDLSISTTNQYSSDQNETLSNPPIGSSADRLRGCLADDDFQVDTNTVMEVNGGMDTINSAQFQPLNSLNEASLDKLVTHSPSLPRSSAMLAACQLRRKNEANFYCDFKDCESTFTRKFNLDGHKRSHCGEKPHKCQEPDCGKSFTRSYDLKRHQKLHNGFKPYTCEFCGKSFARPDAVSGHQRGDTNSNRRASSNVHLQGNEQESPATGSDDQDGKTTGCSSYRQDHAVLLEAGHREETFKGFTL